MQCVVDFVLLAIFEGDVCKGNLWASMANLIQIQCFGIIVCVLVSRDNKVK